MGIASYFNKSALSASQILKDFNVDEFHSRLSQVCIGIYYEDNAINSSEGRCTLDLLLRLISRLYPKISVVSTVAHSVEGFKKLAARINPQIEFTDISQASVICCVGQIDNIPTAADVFYIGSDKFLCKFSRTTPQTVLNTGVPFGAGAAACFAAANIFRYIFEKQLSEGALDTDFTFSTISQNILENSNSDIKEIESSFEVGVAGLGAIGNGFFWALKGCETFNCNITLIDEERLDESNLQRYCLSIQEDVGKLKNDIIEEYLPDRYQVAAYNSKFENLRMRCKTTFDVLISAVDSAQTRINLQSDLPHFVLNAWTEMERVGISRHLNFINQPCLACMYIPKYLEKHQSQIIAETLRIPEQERRIGDILASNLPVDSALVEAIEKANNVPSDKLHSFIGLGINEFVSRVACNGLLLEFDSPEGSNSLTDVPCAFESAFAGIIMATELILLHLNIAKNRPPVTKINLLKPITKYTTDSQSKHSSGNCICQDLIFCDVYTSKWLAEK